MGNRESNAMQFVNRLNWKINYGEITKMSIFQIDVYKFTFNPYLEYELTKQFGQFLKTLHFTEIRSVALIWVWLYQHGVKFRLRFGYNPRLKFLYNIKNILMPGMINRMLKDCGHNDLMTAPTDPAYYSKNEKEESSW